MTSTMHFITWKEIKTQIKALLFNLNLFVTNAADDGTDLLAFLVKPEQNVQFLFYLTWEQKVPSETEN